MSMASVSQPLLVVDDLTRRFGERLAVDRIGFEIGAGETYGLLGPNGAGKTTTISMIAGILTADAGTVHVAGQRVTARAGAAKAMIGLVPQDIALYGELSAVENLRFFGRLQGMGGKSLEARIGEVLEIVGLADRAKDRIDEYSGGMKRRANIAAGLLHRPKLLILDEPTVGVDPQSRNQILASIEELGGAGLSVLYTTHYMEEAERLCRRIGIVDEGRLVAQGTQRELVALIGVDDRLVLQLDGDLDAAVAVCRGAEGVNDVHVADDQLTISVTDAGRSLSSVVAAVGTTGLAIRSVEVKRPDLETVFLTLTGRALRDSS
jgi:ABC-2 type transport system ATP-binding protein